MATVEVSRLDSYLAGVLVEMVGLNKYKMRHLLIESREKLEVTIDLMVEDCSG